MTCFRHGIDHIIVEKRILKIFRDICISMGRNREVILCLLVLSSYFDTLKHTVLLQRLRVIGNNGSELEWFRSYLKDCTTSIKVNNYVSLALGM